MTTFASLGWSNSASGFMSLAGIGGGPAGLAGAFGAGAGGLGGAAGFGGAGRLCGTAVGAGFEPSTKSCSGFLRTVRFAPCWAAFRRRPLGAFGFGGSPVRGAPG